MYCLAQDQGHECYSRQHIQLSLCFAGFSEGSLHLEASNETARQEINCMLWRLKFRYYIHNSLTFAAVSRRISPVYILPLYLFKIHFDIIFLFKNVFQEFFPLPVFAQKLCMYSSFIKAYHTPTNIILPGFIALIISSDKYQ